jgi:hypothetical protein
MLLGRIVAAPVALFSGLLIGCSDPPAEPAEGALTISVSPAQGAHCNGQHGQLLMPQNTLVQDRLNCDLSQSGCNPGEYVAVDGDSDTNVSCNVTKSASGFSIQASMAIGGNNVSFSGALSPTGGDVTMTHRSVNTQINLSGQCTITIAPNHGAIDGGKIWAQYTCPNVSEPGSASGDQCVASGAFIFERCGGG